jgi:hypothetical protein
MEAWVFLSLLTLFSPWTLANLVVASLRALIGTNRARRMRGAVRASTLWPSIDRPSIDTLA